MKQHRLTLWMMATLLSSSAFAHHNPPQKFKKFSSDIFYITEQEEDTVKNTTDKPIYNLYQLSKLIISKNDNLAAAGYINNLIDNSKLSDDEKDKLRVKLFKNLSITNSKIKFEEDLKEYLINKLNKIEDKSFLVNFNDDLKKEIENINKLNIILSEYKSVNLIESLNNEIPLIYTTLNDIKSERIDSLTSKENIDSTHQNNQPLNDSLIIDINRVLDLSGNFKIESLDESTLSKLNIYNKTLCNIILKLDYVNDNQLKFHKSFSNIQEILGAEEYINLIIKNKSDNVLLKDLSEKKSKEIKEEDYTSNINFALTHYKKVRDKRNVLFNKVVNQYISLNNNTKLSDATKEKAKLDLSVPLKPSPISERIEDKVIPNNKLKLPSESDIIHGVALFMANRAKQETMIWFVDKLKKELNNSLIKSSFPLTYAKLIEHDDLRVPEFNSSWQMAISEDFVKMPQNVLNSQWLSEKANKANKTTELNNIKLTYNFSQRFISLLNGKNDLRNVFEDLYTQKVNYSDNKIRTSLFRSIEFLYILMNEFYTIDSNQKLNALTYTDFEKITDEQWSVLLDLVKLKYGKGAYDDLNYIIYKLKSNQNIENVNRQFAHITNSFESIELLSKSSDFNSKEEKAAELIDKTIVLLKYFDPDFNSINNTFNSTKYLQIKQFEDLLNIYKSINNKEFGNSAKSIISFLKPLVSDRMELVYANNILSLDYNTKNLNIISLFEGNQNIKIKDAKKNQKNISINLSKNLGFKKETNFEINVESGKLNFIFNKNKNENYSLDLNEFNVEFSELKNLKFNSESFAKFLNKSNDLRSLVERFIKESKEKVDEKQIYKYVEFIAFISETSNNPLEMFKSYVDKPNLVHLNDINKENLNSSGDLLVKTTTFFSDILHARDEHGVYRAINNAVAPPTSYMTKRKYPHTLTLNGYVGGYFGYQSSASIPADYKKGLSYGITAPIGVTYSTPKWGLFIYPIDLGNIVGHYIWETNRDYEKQKVSLKEVFSPGLSFLYNIQDSPFVLFTGMKLVQIPEYYDENRGYVNSKTFDLIQFNAGIKIDIPFFTIKAWKPKNNFFK